MTRIIDIDGGGYDAACEGCYAANHGVVGVLSWVADVVAEGGEMAGRDAGGQRFAERYDPVARRALSAGSDLAEALGSAARLLDASVDNHCAAEAVAHLVPCEGRPVDPRRTIEQLSVSDPPSAAGGPDLDPTWWHWVADHVGGLLWPDADTDRLRTVGHGWTKAGAALAGSRDDLDTTVAMLSDQHSMEIPDAVTALRTLSGAVDELTWAMDTLGRGCLDYADAVEEHRHLIEHELVSFIEWSVGIEVAGAIAGALTAGGAEGPAQAAEAARIARAAARVREILTALAEIARGIAETIGAAAGRLAELAGSLARFRGARVARALEEAGAEERAATELPAFAQDAEQLRRKFKHAAAFGVSGACNAENVAKFKVALETFLHEESTVVKVDATYRGQEAILCYNAESKLMVLLHPDGSFWSAWKLRPAQLVNVIERGSL